MNKAAVIHSGGLGDFILSLRLAEALRRNGAGHITYLGRGAYRGLAARCEFIDAYRDIETGGFHGLFSAEGELPRTVREVFAGVDLVLNLLGGGPVTRRRLCELGVGRVVEIDTRPRLDWKDHVSEQWLGDLEAAGLGGRAGPPALRFDRRDSADSSGMAAAAARRVILHPGSGAPGKCWPLDRFLALGERISTDGWAHEFMLGPAELERFGSEEISKLERQCPVAFEEDLCAAAQRLADAQLFVGNDSGVAHLAAAAGVCVVAVFGPTPPQTWRPLGTRAAVAAAQRAWPSVAEVRRVIDQVVRVDAARTPA